MFRTLTLDAKVLLIIYMAIRYNGGLLFFQALSRNCFIENVYFWFHMVI